MGVLKTIVRIICGIVMDVLLYASIVFWLPILIAVIIVLPFFICENKIEGLIYSAVLFVTLEIWIIFMALIGFFVIPTIGGFYISWKMIK